MMGWMQRERERQERECGVHQFRIRRWTAMEWTYPAGQSKSARKAHREQRKHNESYVERAASFVQRRLMELRLDWNPAVTAVRVDREPQLLFEMIVPGIDEADARKRAAYVFERALSVKVPTGNVHGPRREPLRPPWGKVEIEPV